MKNTSTHWKISSAPSVRAKAVMHSGLPRVIYSTPSLRHRLDLGRRRTRAFRELTA